MKNPYLVLMKITWQNIGEYKLLYVLELVLHILSSSTMLLTPYILAKLVNVLQVGGENVFKDALFYLLMFPLLTIVYWIFNAPAMLISVKIGFFLEKNFRESIFNTVMKLPMKWHQDNHSGKTLHRVNRASSSLRQFSKSNFMYIENMIRFVGAIVALILIMSTFGFVSLLTSVIIFSGIFYFDKYLFKKRMEINKLERNVDSAFYDYISNIVTVITLRIERLVKKEVTRHIIAVWPDTKKYARVNETKWFITSILLSFSTFAFLTFYCYEKYTAGGIILVGTTVMLYQYLQNIEQSFFQFAWQYGEIVRFHADLKGVDEIVDTYNELDKNNKVLSLPKKWENIKIQNLWFAYEDDKHLKHQLKNVNLDIPKGAKIALVGESGSGKSTLMTLLRGLYSPQKVKLDIDGKKYESLKILNSKTTLIPQEPEIFENTIEYNVAAGIKHRPEDINECIKLACFGNVIKRLSKGIKTDINEKGVNLSGGEKQRLALARGLFASKGSEIILLDESTSSVDIHNEMDIYKNLMSLYKEEALIASIHKLNLIQFFDIIYVLKNGEVVEKGTFTELMSNNKEFKNMWEKYQENLKS